MLIDLSYVKYEILSIQNKVDTIILSTPTGKTREQLTLVNMSLFKLIDEIDNKNN